MDDSEIKKSFDMAMNCSEAISLTPLQNIWHFDKTNTEMISKLVKHKVCAVSETRIGGVVSWKGDFDSGEYFLVIVIEGCVYAACNEHEMMLPHELQTVAYADAPYNILEEKDQVKKWQLWLEAKISTFPTLMSKLNFQEIMNIFMWEYVSPNVEIYETILI